MAGKVGISSVRGTVAQWLEHCLVTAEVAGSNPVGLVSFSLELRSSL
jgi:hypothetical protein